MNIFTIITMFILITLGVLILTVLEKPEAPQEKPQQAASDSDIVVCRSAKQVTRVRLPNGDIRPYYGLCKH